MGDRIIVLLVVVPGAEHKVRQAVDLLCVGAADRGVIRVAVISGVVIGAVFGMEVAHCGVDHLILNTELQALPPKDLRVIHLRIKNDGILILRIAILPPQLGKSSPEILSVESSGKGRVSRDIRNLEPWNYVAKSNWVLAALGIDESDTAFEHRSGSYCPRSASNRFVVARIDVAVRISTGGTRN